MGWREKLSAWHRGEEAGQELSFLFFWGHKTPTDGSIGPTCLSQWYEAEFVVGEIRYPTAEHFMMAEKARVFEDHAALAAIIQADDPGHAKKLGRAVKGFDEQRWTEVRFDIVVRGNTHKFEQNEKLRWFLLGTREAILVEASPRDTIWGIGMGASNPAARDPAQWRGLNLLGSALMDVRAALRDRGDGGSRPD